MIEETWLEQFIGDGGLAFDIGANDGDWSARLARSYANVVAVEPDERAFSVLQASTAQSVHCLNCAVTAKDGEVDFYLRHSTLQSSLLMEHPIGGADMAAAPPQQVVKAAGVTLDSLLSRARVLFGADPDFIKVDVEGAEGDVLAGATDAAFRKAKWLIEVHDRAKDVGVQLARLGYEKVRIVRHPYESAHPNHFWIYAA